MSTTNPTNPMNPMNTRIKTIKELKQKLNIPNNRLDELIYSLATESYSIQETADTIYEMCFEGIRTSYESVITTIIEVLKEYKHELISEHEISESEFIWTFTLNEQIYKSYYDYSENRDYEFEGIQDTTSIDF